MWLKRKAEAVSQGPGDSGGDWQSAKYSKQGGHTPVLAFRDGHIAAVWGARLEVAESTGRGATGKGSGRGC